MTPLPAALKALFDEALAVPQAYVHRWCTPTRAALMVRSTDRTHPHAVLGKLPKSKRRRCLQYHSLSNDDTAGGCVVCGWI